MGSDMHGARGETMELRVPCGTLVERLGLPSPSRTSRMEPPDAPRTTLAELLTDGDSILVARGGRGGRGNASFRQGLQQHARIAEDGGAGEAATLLLSLKRASPSLSSPCRPPAEAGAGRGASVATSA